MCGLRVREIPVLRMRKSRGAPVQGMAAESLALFEKLKGEQGWMRA